MLETIGKLLLEQSVKEWGVCAFADTLPLLDCKNAQLLPDKPKSVIVALFPYLLEKYPERNISKYAVVADYHKVCGEKLSKVCDKLKEVCPNQSFVSFLDNSPIREVRAASLAGVGALGRNGLLINRLYGSYVFIGEIVTDLQLPAFDGKPSVCIGCGACEKSCPGQAIKDFKIDREKCLSHITQKKGTLTPEEEKLIADNGSVWGCDICSDVCPMNKNALSSNITEFQDDTVFKAYYPENNRQIKDRAFGFRGAQVIRRNLDLIAGKGNK